MSDDTLVATSVLAAGLRPRPTKNGLRGSAGVPSASTARRRVAPVVPFRALRLVPPAPPPVCVETIEALEQLIDGARRGHYIGIAFAVTTSKREYMVDTIGDFRSNPTYARGAVAVLDDELRELIREGAGSTCS